MQSPSLRDLTASEPLTLDQEYEMQKSWREDGDKLTFIVCLAQRGGETERMIGDVNLFLFPDEDGDGAIVGELELMIALLSHRHQGHGRTALLTFMAYILRHWAAIAREFASSSTAAASTSASETAALELAYLRARIHESNDKSIRLFEGVGFERTTAGANYFGEVEVRWKGDVEDLRRCKGWVGEGREVRYG